MTAAIVTHCQSWCLSINSGGTHMVGMDKFNLTASITCCKRLPLVYTMSRCLWLVVTCVCACMCGSLSTLCEEDIDSVLTGCWLSSLREDEACLDVRWESRHRGVMRQSDREAEGERRAYVRAEDDDNKLSVSADMTTALSGSDYLQYSSKMWHKHTCWAHTCASDMVSASLLVSLATFLLNLCSTLDITLTM